MLNPQDLYTYCLATPLVNANNNNRPFGTLIVHYELRKYRDIRNLGDKLAYLLFCKHRVIIPNSMVYQPGPSAAKNYANYPAVVVNSIRVQANDGATVLLRQLFPKTLNTAVTTAANLSDSNNSSSSNQHSSGSSTSQTNTFGVALSAGYFGVPFGSLTLDYQHGWESGSSKSHSWGTETGQQSGASSGDSMSVKDWSAYGLVDDNSQTPTWIWGQTYPWDVIQYNQFAPDGASINLPSFVQARMLDESLVLPPSQLSLFGVDFTMTASWLVEFPDGFTVPEALTITHDTMCYTASHSLNGTVLVATLQNKNQAASSTNVSPSLDLSTYALDPILTAAAKNGAAIGFTTNRFTLPPAAGSFKIVSPANNLQVSGTGFDKNMTSNFSGKTSLSIQFKVIDIDNEYALLFMHWLGEGSGPCKLTVTINTRWTIVFYVDYNEGQGGQNNVSAIELRNLDFTAVNYHDYLLDGLNEIDVLIEAVDQNPASYSLFALAIGQV